MLNLDNIFSGLPEGVTTPIWRFPVGEALTDGDVIAKFTFNKPLDHRNLLIFISAPQIALAEAPVEVSIGRRTWEASSGAWRAIVAFNI